MAGLSNQTMTIKLRNGYHAPVHLLCPIIFTGPWFQLASETTSHMDLYKEK